MNYQMPLLPPTWKLAKLAADAYREDTVPVIKEDSSEIYFHELAGGGVALVWRGSQGGYDWLMDLRSVPWYCQELRLWLHRGFLVCARSTWPQLKEKIKEGKYKYIVCIGHSKGAAEATINAAMLVQAGYYVRSLITFGSPRCGYSGLGEMLKEAGVAIMRYVHGSDMVTKVPALLGWHHVAKAIYLMGSAGPVGDHSMDLYYQALRPGDSALCFER